MYCVGGKNEGAGSVYYILILVPEERPFILEFGIVRFDDHHARNHAAGDECVVGSIIAIGDEFRRGADRRHVRDSVHGMRTENVVEATKRFFRPNDGGKSAV